MVWSARPRNTVLFRDSKCRGINRQQNLRKGRSIYFDLQQTTKGLWLLNRYLRLQGDRTLVVNFSMFSFSLLSYWTVIFDNDTLIWKFIILSKHHNRVTFMRRSILSDFYYSGCACAHACFRALMCALNFKTFDCTSLNRTIKVICFRNLGIRRYHFPY